MNLHPLIPNHDLPKCLRSPLVIGNLEQIKALKILKKDIENKLARKAKIESGELKSFDVTIKYEGSQTLKIYAENREQAEKHALEIADVYDYDDMEINVNYVKEINKEISP
jgi:hypothetical protein